MSSTAEESALYASANREHFSAFDRLEEISKRKINPKYINQNINQQAGYSAEIKEQARVNEHNILAKKGERVWQYDDLSSGQKAQVKKLFPNYATPKKNHEIVDYISVDEKGNVIPGTLTQSKFVGKNGEECFKKLLSKDYEKYFENGALIGGGVSLVTNVYECVAKGKDPIKALKHTLVATAKGGALSYGSAFTSSSLGGWIQSSANGIIQSLGKGSLPAMIVGACVANATVLTRYLSGKIDKTELLKQLVKANTTLVSSGAMAVAGQALIPIPVVGALVGGFVGAVLSETFYFHETTKFFNQNFDELERALYAGDADLAIGVNNKIQERLGQKPLFNNTQEFLELMNNGGKIEI
ncbi:hypothetical protein [Helicobacter pylori]|uniref:hypothetical protein n=1 Tax=Helicobacter pylori TaxID=210 RepID=UPI000EADF07C|nr:hypothetical protein [Helicobacter pylori]